ncbi:MAG: hypothetical protein IPP72_14080 [Chitinophagaceae bacterium]|nr:hypothetical protein [Chitinophagaceae bacterium]
MASAGIYSGNGATANTITNNKFYQTGTRTFATGTFLHCAIQVNNTASAAGFTITGNTIGYASSTQTGTYTLAGATFAGKFNAIVFSGLTGGAPPPFPITPSLQ